IHVIAETPCQGTPNATATSTPTATATNTPLPAPTCGSGSNYVISQSTGVAIVPGTTDTGNHCDDCTTNIALPFAYSLYGQSFTSANVSSNGTLQFVSNSTAFTNACLPQTLFNNTIFPHWDDLRTDVGLSGCASYTGGCGVFV